MPPPHGNLKGKDIGLFYAARSKKNRRQHENESRAHVLMSQSQQTKIKSALANVKSMRQDRTKQRSVFQNLTSRRSSDCLFSASGSSTQQSHESLNNHLKFQLDAKRNEEQYQKMMRVRETLPAFKMRSEILRAIDENQVCVISGETGCGKTTQVPQLILDYCIFKDKASDCKVICTQPRRISAISIAQRVASERNEPLGQSTGYSIRVEHKYPRDSGCILYCTAGMLLRWIHSDPLLSKASHVILDEVHERSAVSDLLLVLLKRLVLSGKRPDLKVILMSATLNAEEFSRYYRGCKTLHIPGFTYPVTEFYLEDALQLTGYNPMGNLNYSSRNRKRKRTESSVELEEALKIHVRELGSKYNDQTRKTLLSMDQEAFDEHLIHSLVRFICNTQQEGAILIFVPGWEQIRRVVDLLNEDIDLKRHLVLPLHSLMPTAEQGAIFKRPPDGIRKIIVSTAIAETSITIDDVVYVIDCGKTKEANYDVDKNVKTLQPEWISQASAKQRRGRAGRVQKGYCFHLYAKIREQFLLKYQVPEIQRMSLEGTILELINLEVGGVKQFFAECMNPPSEKSVNQAIRELQQMNAITSDMRLTPLGFHLAQLPVEPRIGKFILYGSIFSCLDPVLSIAACFSHKDPFVVPINKEKQVQQAKLTFSSELCDPLVYSNAVFQYERLLRNNGQGLDSFCWQNFLSKATLKFLVEMKRQFAEYLFNEGFIHSKDYTDVKYNKFSQCDMLVKAMVVAGFYPSIIKVNTFHVRSTFTSLFSTYSRVDVHIKSVAADMKQIPYNYLVNYMRVKSLGGVNLYDVSPAHPNALMLFGSDVRKGTDDNGEGLLVIDKEISFKCDPDLADTIIDLSKELDHLLEAKISKNSSEDDLTSLERVQEALTKAVVDLLVNDQNC